MTKIVATVFNFLWVTVWGKINVKELIANNRDYLILTITNIIISLLFLYMTEQTTVRTDQLRAARLNIEKHQIELIELTIEKESLELELETIKETLGDTTVELDVQGMLTEYETWTNEVEQLRIEDDKEFNRLLGELNERTKSNTGTSNSED